MQCSVRKCAVTFVIALFALHIACRFPRVEARRNRGHGGGITKSASHRKLFKQLPQYQTGVGRPRFAEVGGPTAGRKRPGGARVNVEVSVRRNGHRPPGHHQRRYRGHPLHYPGSSKSIFHNPYFHIITSTNDFEWTREHGWQHPNSEDEYHTLDETTTTTTAPETTATVDERTVSWKGEGSFTGDIRLACLEKNRKENCAYGVVQIYYKELDKWGTICGDTWNAGAAQVICNYLNYRNSKPLKLGPKKIPDDVETLSKFIRKIRCDGTEFAVTDCTGDNMKRNYSCRSNKLAAVKCSGPIRDDDVVDATCHKSEIKCKVGERCIAPEYVCDGMSDCPWASDEDGCSAANCKKDQYWCGPRGGGCIANEYLCDGEPDCIDDSDERDCDELLEEFNKTTSMKMRSKKYEVQWQQVTAYLCAQKCKEEASFLCTSFDYHTKSQICLLYSASATRRLKRSKKWDHYDRGDVEDCSASNKYRCKGGTCITHEQVCDSINDCRNGEEEKECEPIKIRLKGGAGDFEGRVEVSKGLRFGLICDSRWTMREANVVCRQLGYNRGASKALKGGTFERSDRRYVLDNVRCTGRENSLDECDSDGWSNAECSTDHEAGVVCIADETTTPFSTTAQETTPRQADPFPESDTPNSRSQCGIKPEGIVSPQSRVVGGSGADPHEWPWQAGIWLPWTYWCGGALIDPCWVLTAAHCFTRGYSLSEFTVRLGDHVTGIDDGTEQYFEIAELIKHDYNVTTKDNDIALLRIQTKDGNCSRITNEVSTICLPNSPSQFAAKTRCQVTGWGKDAATSTRTYVSVLQEAEIPIISDKKCARESEYQRLGSSMFCAGYMSGGIDSCQGDSGGPLSCRDEDDGRYYVWGLVSWGNGCARPKSPGVYTRVEMFKDWIELSTGIHF